MFNTNASASLSLLAEGIYSFLVTLIFERG
jgi:hypothetical protein